ncbi:ADP-ribosylglycohydrolase family protein [Pyxidicoccus parkwayensis]|uniref:ADP-ribosylglycohydrolase family protein n=1 Tax=Pyxidicoccus parkwayensis TaxID=2813578 RepID=A0ABX7P6P0_9BACT|nr:ADP-ribosylglycohydrolase family protein [Pyxidicoccus parkwaysis]QSQ26150.1 ADP-ribosylglycohydrolase family protein [Pyxidicoccus parkwaysis]
MLLDLAIGDAYGAGFEYASEMMQHNDLSRYVQHPLHLSIRPGMYTDDTQMSLAIAEAIVDGDPWRPSNLATRFVQVFQRDPREGYAQRFQEFLQTVRDGQDFLDRIHGDSDKSGAAMRAGPLGVFGSPSEVIRRCTIQAAITHNTPDGINAACAAALMVHYCLYRIGPKAEVGEFIQEHVPGQWIMSWHGKVDSKGWMSVRAAITALARNDSMSALLKDCVAFGGDVDTVAAMALAAGSCCEEIEQNLPQHLIDGLENGPYGRDYIRALDERLIQFANS